MGVGVNVFVGVLLETVVLVAVGVWFGTAVLVAVEIGVAVAPVVFTVYVSINVPPFAIE
jgi:hypothetical protein